MSGSGTLEVSRVCDTVVIWRRVCESGGGCIERAHWRAERKRRAIVM